MIEISYDSEYYEIHFPDPQEKKVSCKCDVTEAEIYDGDYCLLTPDGSVLADDMDALMAYFNVLRVTAGEFEKWIED